MAQVAERRRTWREAQIRLEEYLKKSPDDILGWQRLGHAQFMLDDKLIAEAYRSLQHAKQIDVENSKKNHSPEQMLPPAAILGAVLNNEIEQKAHFNGPSKDAMKMFLYALKNNPDNPKLRCVVGIWALENGEIALAKEQAKQTLRIGANGLPADQNLDALMLNGIVALWEKRWANAQAFFEKAFLVEPTRFDVRNYLALAYVEQSIPARNDKALDLAYANYQNNKDNIHSIEAAATLSWVYFRIGNVDLASAAMDGVLCATNGDVSDPDMATYLAYIFDQNDNGHNGLKFKAKQILENVIKAGRPFRMKPEATKLYEKLKDEKPP